MDKILERYILSDDSKESLNETEETKDGEQNGDSTEQNGEDAVTNASNQPKEEFGSIRGSSEILESTSREVSSLNELRRPSIGPRASVSSVRSGGRVTPAGRSGSSLAPSRKSSLISCTSTTSQVLACFCLLY